MVPKVQLKELCKTEITDGTHKTPTYADSGYIFLSSKNVTTGKINWNDVMYIPEELHNELYARIKPQKDDILLAKNGTTGVAAIVDRDEVFDIYVSLALIRPDKEKVEPRYLLHAVNSEPSKKFFTEHLKGIGVPNLHLTHIRETPIKVPSIVEQKKIIDVLDKVDELISCRKEQLAKLDELVKSRFIELFGDPVLNPKGFAEGCVNEYCKMTQGTQIPMSEQISEYQQGYYRYLYIRDLKYIDSDWIYVQDKYDDKKLTEKDLVVVNTGNTAGEIYYGKDGILSNNLFKVSFDTEVLNTTYMFAYFSSQQFQSMLWSEMKEGTQPHLGHKIFGSKKLILPPTELQEQFAAFVKQTDKSKLAVQESLEKLETLKKSMMQKYFG